MKKICILSIIVIGLLLLTNASYAQKAFQFGFSGTTPFFEDFDGDGLLDAALYYPPTGTWYINQTTEGILIKQFGWVTAIPVPGDYNGDGKADIGVYDNQAGMWYIDGITNRQFGFANTIPLPADLDHNGVTDISVYDPSSGYWYLSENRTAGFYQHHYAVGTWQGSAFNDTYILHGDGSMDGTCYQWTFSGTWLPTSDSNITFNIFRHDTGAPVHIISNPVHGIVHGTLMDFIVDGSTWSNYAVRLP